MSDEYVSEKALVRRRTERTGTIVRALTLGICTLLVILVIGTLVYIVQLQQQINDCIDPHGGCFKNSKQRSAQTVKDILTGIDRLEQQRASTSKSLLQNQQQVAAALKQLCKATHTTCSSLK